MSRVSSWNVKTSDSSKWLHYKGVTREDALKQARIDHPNDDPAGFDIFRSNVDDTRADWVAVYPDGNFPE